MGILRRILSSDEQAASASFLKKLHGWSTAFWVLNLPVVNGVYVLLPSVWKAVAVLYLINISVLALVLSGLAAWQGARVEVLQDVSGEDGGDGV